MSTFEDQLNKVRTQPGFLAALDQSGGSTPKALRIYGVEESAYSGDEEMFAMVHAMRIVGRQFVAAERVLCLGGRDSRRLRHQYHQHGDDGQKCESFH